MFYLCEYITLGLKIVWLPSTTFLKLVWAGRFFFLKSKSKRHVIIASICPDKGANKSTAELTHMNAKEIYQHDPPCTRIIFRQSMCGPKPLPISKWLIRQFSRNFRKSRPIPKGFSASKLADSAIFVKWDCSLRIFSTKMGPCLRIFGEKVTYLGGTSPYALTCEYPLRKEHELAFMSLPTWNITDCSCLV